MRIPTRLLATLVVILGLQKGTAQASFIIYSASDAGAASNSPRPNSNAMAATFDAAAAALSPVSLLTFESAPLGTFTSLAAGPGVTLTGTDNNGGRQTIRNVPDGAGESDSIYGYNTTAGGSRFLYVHGGVATFTFAPGVQSFGAYISGIQFAGETITFNDGTSQTVAIPGLAANDGGIAFVGFTDSGRSITSITINATGSGGADFLGIDDVRFGPATPASITTPAPSGLLLALTGGLTGWIVPWFRRRTR